jgi:hypothetical protein
MIAVIDHQSLSPTPLRPRQSLRSSVSLETFFRRLSDPIHTGTPAASLGEGDVALSEQSSEESPQPLNLPIPHFEAHAADLIECRTQRDLDRLTSTLTAHAATYRLVAQWYRERGCPDILGFPGPGDMSEVFVDELVRIIDRSFDTERTATAITDFLSGLCAASQSWKLFLLGLGPLRQAVSNCCFSSATDLSANAIRLSCHCWDCELRTPSADIGPVLDFIIPFAHMTKRHALEVISALHILISTPRFCDADGPVVLTCDIMCEIIVSHPSRSVRTEILGLYEHMISQQVDPSVFLEHSFFEAFVLQLNVTQEGSEYKFPPVVLTFIIDRGVEASTDFHFILLQAASGKM